MEDPEVSFRSKDDVLAAVASATEQLPVAGLAKDLQDTLAQALTALTAELQDATVPDYRDRVGVALGRDLDDVPGGTLQETLAQIWLFYEYLPNGFNWEWRVMPAKDGDDRKALSHPHEPSVAALVPRRFENPIAYVAQLIPDSGDVGDLPDEQSFVTAGLWSLAGGRWAVLEAATDDVSGPEAYWSNAPRFPLGDAEGQARLVSIDLADTQSQEDLWLKGTSEGFVAISLADPEGQPALADSLAECAALLPRYGYSPGDMAEPNAIAHLLGEAPPMPAVADCFAKARHIVISDESDNVLLNVYSHEEPVWSASGRRRGRFVRDTET